MQTLISHGVRGVFTLLLATGMILGGQGLALAVDGTWSNTAGGDYLTPGNWLGGVNVAQGTGATAHLETLDITSDVNITLNAPLTVGNMLFGDTNLGSAGTWAITTTNLAGSAITLNNSGPRPQITVTPLTPTAFDDAFIGNNIAGTAGLAKLGAGILTFGPGTASTLTGGFDIQAGTLRLQSLFPEQTVTMANGTTLETSGIVRGITVASGGTATVRATGALTGLGSVLPATPNSNTTLNLESTSNGQIDVQRDWAGFTNFNIKGTNAAVTPLRLVINSNTGAANVWNNQTWANSKLNLNNAALFVRSNSNGNTVPIGELTGTATGELRGGNTGTAVRWQIGALNTSTTFNGVINGAGGVTINKVGTGTLTLAGTFNGSPALAGQSGGRTGGVFRVTDGILKITGASFIPGGPNGLALTTIDVLAGKTFDVSGAPSTFTTQVNQKVQGSGTLLGNWAHTNGQINPGDVGAPTPANEDNMSAAVTPTAGVITFQGNVNINGGNIIYDMSPIGASGNDLMQVTGVTTLTSGKIVPNILSAPPQPAQTYTVINSTGGFIGAATNLTVDFPGRGTDPVPFLSGDGKNLQFTAPSGGLTTASLVWTGANGTAWDVETTQNWTNAGSPDKYFNGDTVAFNETGTKTVVLNGTANPTNMTMNNTTAYNFSGLGAIFGSTGLTKTGTGQLTMNINNTFTGAASVTGSTVDVTGFTGLGSGPLTLSNATFKSTISMSNSTLDIPTGTTSTIQLDGAAAEAGTSNIPVLTGGGTVNLTSIVANKFFGTFASSGFTGTLNVAPTTPATALGQLRIRGGQTDFTNAVVNLTATSVSNQLGAAAGSTVTMAFGEIHADATSGLTAFNGGSVPPHINWQIGAKNTDSNIGGVIADGAGAGTPSISNVTKVGTGKLTLTGANTYTGRTTVQAGILSITNPGLVLANAMDILISSGATLDLNFPNPGDTDSIHGLYFQGNAEPVGKYGSLLSSAPNKRSYLTGLGILDVLFSNPIILSGDYNGDLRVDAADYTVYRDHLASSQPFTSGETASLGVVDTADYDAWKLNFGAILSSVVSNPVPEPSSLILASLAIAFAAAVGLNKRKTSN